MAASTITRDTWTNDTGSAAVPNADGTILNNSVLQNHIYARIDAMFAGAGAYATLTHGGLIAAEGFGTHNFVSAGTGRNAIFVRNTSAGVGNYAQVVVQADSTTLAEITQFSTTWTTAGDNIADSAKYGGTGAGGVVLSAGHAAGIIRFCTAAGTEQARIDTDGSLLCLDGSVSRSTGPVTPLNSYGGLALKSSGGGLTLYGMQSATPGVLPAIELYAHGDTGTGDTAKSTSANGFIVARASENNSTIGANENIFAAINYNLTRFILDADGDSHQDVGTAWTNFDDHDDVALLTALSAAVSRADDPLRASFAGFLETHRETLERSRIVTFNEDGHHFINWSRAHMLTIGAIRQLGLKLERLEQRLALEA